MFEVLTMRFTVENLRHKVTFEPENHFCYRVFTRQNLPQVGRNVSFGKLDDIQDDWSGKRFYTWYNFENRVALRHRVKNVRMRGFWLQLFMFLFVSNDGFEVLSDNEPFPQSCVFKKKLKTILISSDIRLFKSNPEGWRKIVDVVVPAADYLDRESNKNRH